MSSRQKRRTKRSGNVMACQRKTPQKVEESRKKASSHRQNQTLMGTGYNPNFSPSPSQPKRSKKRSGKKGKALSKAALELDAKFKRPNMSAILSGGHVKHHPGKVHSSLHSAANSLQKNMLKDNLHKKLKNRPTAKEMVNRGHLRKDHKKVHGKVQQMQKKLAKNMTKDILSKSLKNRPARAELHQKNILNKNHAKKDTGIVSKAMALEKQMKVDKLSLALRNKPSIHDMHEMGILNKNDVVGLNVRMQADEVHPDDKKEHLENFLANRPTKKEIIDSGVHKGTSNVKAHHSIHVVGAKLQKQMLMDQLNKKIAQRPDMKQILGHGIDHQQKVDRSLHAPMKALQNAMIKDTIHSHLRNRPDIEDLKEQGVFHVTGEYISEISEEEAAREHSIPKALDDIKRCIHNAHAFKYWLLQLDRE